MSNRICVYKDCHNLYYRQDSSVCRDVTLFAFPKDPKRAEQWRQLGQVHPKITNKQLFMCSKHFAAKFLSISKNRRILLGEAMPFPYEPQNGTDQMSEDDNPKQMTPTSSTAQQKYCINRSRAQDDSLTELLPTSSSAQQSFYINLEDDNLSIDKVVMVEATTTQAREPSETDLFDKIELSIVPPPRKRARTVSRSPSPELYEPDPSDEQLIDANEVSIFKFKGEQHVQMSREYYLQEKRQLLAQLSNYKRILSHIKTELMPLKEI